MTNRKSYFFIIYHAFQLHRDFFTDTQIYLSSPPCIGQLVKSFDHKPPMKNFHRLACHLAMNCMFPNPCHPSHIKLSKQNKNLVNAFVSY